MSRKKFYTRMIYVVTYQSRSTGRYFCKHFDSVESAKKNTSYLWRNNIIEGTFKSIWVSNKVEYSNILKEIHKKNKSQ